jgi:hypothetical protein
MVFDHPNVTAMAGYLDRLLGADEPAAEATLSASVGDAVVDMTDDEVEALLLKKLSEMSRP